MRISEKFRELEAKGESALIVYISCGDPSVAETVKAARSIIAAGCDILELGLPFSDPIADGPTIQAASQRAIAGGMNTDRYFETCKKIEVVPKVCMTYYNLIYQYGLDRFVEKCAESDITGLIVPDLPPEEAGPLKRACDAGRVDLIYIVSPTTSKERLRKIRSSLSCKGQSCNSYLCECGGFVYLQSVLGVTGARDTMKVNLMSKIQEVKSVLGLPVAVGFGISKPEQVRNLVEQGADGVIVGSAVVEKIAAGKDIVPYVRLLKQATRSKRRTRPHGKIFKIASVTS